ncbi:hypothetical protein Dimus_013217 [Dionaea muscipula]
MVIGPRAKSRRGPMLQLDYLVHVLEIKPWPPSQSLKIVRSVLIQWENGDKSSGSTSTVVPSLDDGRIEFNESFRIPVTLIRDMSLKSMDADVFLKNLLEFSLFEPRREKTVKGQVLGTAIVDLAEYGGLKESTSFGVPMSCTRCFGNTAQPILYVKIQPVGRLHSRSSSKGSLPRVTSLDKNSVDSASALTSEEYVEEAEFASFTDDDVSSHSSVTVSSALDSNGGFPSPNGEGGSGMRKEDPDLHSKLVLEGVDKSAAVLLNEIQKNVSTSVSADLSSDPGTRTLLASSKTSHEIDEGIAKSKGRLHNSEENMTNSFFENAASLDSINHVHEKLNSVNGTEGQAREGSEGELQMHARKYSVEIKTKYDVPEADATHHNDNRSNGELVQVLEARAHSLGVESLKRFYLNAGNQVSPEHDCSFNKDRVRHVKSVRSAMDSARGNGSAGGSSVSIERNEDKVYPAERRNVPWDSKVQELEGRIKILERELREAAAIEISLYSVVAEHGSSISKVHAPARRLSRLYLQACKQRGRLRRASAARSAVSGLVVVAKACGNDVPRLTFWLSNCVVFRAIICQTFSEQQLPVSVGHSLDKHGSGQGIDKKAPQLVWKASSSGKKDIRNMTGDSYNDWEDPHTLASALEKVESWIFTRIVESVWWQTLTPHMQSSAAKVMDKSMEVGSRKNYRRTSSSGDQEQVNLSLALWTNAFKDASERLCPVRAGGHECGCLPVLAKLIMEQCVARLDVAMFNAILRESADDIPTDPVSDPISDSKVLPIPAGRSSFGAGAQLKNAIGNWSRWLSDLFGMDDDDPVDDENDDDDQRQMLDSSSKSFHLLKSLSDLMMLPKDMLLCSTIRKEVCPTFGAPLIRRVLDNFVPDEFCPDPVPLDVFQALDSEDAHEDPEGWPITNVPCVAPAAVYSPPSASSLACIVGDIGTQSQLRRSGSSLLKKSITSDDELEELNSIFVDSPPMSPPKARPAQQPKGTDTDNAVRYQLLREVWMNCE